MKRVFLVGVEFLDLAAAKIVQELQLAQTDGDNVALRTVAEDDRQRHGAVAFAALFFVLVRHIDDDQGVLVVSIDTCALVFVQRKDQILQLNTVMGADVLHFLRRRRDQTNPVAVAVIAHLCEMSERF